MCSYVVLVKSIEGHAKGAQGWFPATRLVVDYDHPTEALLEHSINIDFLNPQLGAGARAPLELTIASAKTLAAAILSAVAIAEDVEREEARIRA